MSLARPHLQSLIFEVTQDCNHACRYCYNVWRGPQATPYPRGQLDTARTLALLGKALNETRCFHVTLTGGEPLLRPDLLEILEFLQQRRVQTTVISNGRLLDDAMVAACVERGVGLFELPLLSHRREAHDALCGAPGGWDAVLAAMASIRLHRGQVIAAFVATRENIGHLYEMIRVAFAFGARGVMFNRFNPGGRGREHMAELLPTVAEVCEALAAAEAAAVDFGLPISCSIPLQPCLIDMSLYPHLTYGFCAVGTNNAYYTLDPLGNLRPCNHSDTILGNLFDASFANLLASQRLADFVAAAPAFCAECPRRLECQGGCKAAAQVCYGTLDAEEPFLRQR